MSELKDLDAVDVIDRLDDLLTVMNKLAAKEPPKPPDIVVTPNVSAPDVKVESPVHVTVQERQPESYRVHNIKRDDNKLITSFEISVVRNAK